MSKANLPLRLILGTLALSFATSARAAAPMCSDVFAATRFTKMDDKVTDKQVAVFEKVVADLNASLGELVAPRNVQIQVFTEHSSPAADPTDMSIRAGVRFFQPMPKHGIPKYIKRKDVAVKKYHKDPSYSVPILAHEYGHLIFMENYTRREPIWRETFENYKQIRPKLVEMQNASDAIQKELAAIYGEMKSPEITPERRMELLEKIKSLSAQNTKLSDEASELIKPMRMVRYFNTAYNEFFADVVAVLYTGKGGIIDGGVSFTRALQGDNKYSKESKHSDQERNFENNLKHDGDYEGHGYFSLTRNDVWTSYLASPSYRANKSGEIMTAIFNAVAKENSRVMREPVKMEDEATWKILNQKLAEAIDQELSARGIEKLK